MVNSFQNFLLCLSKVAVLDKELVYSGAFILRYFALSAVSFVQLLLGLEVKKTAEQ